MLRSAGYFSSFSCPFKARGCRRPHCQYRHDAGRRPAPSSLQPLRGSPVRGLGKNVQELERLNKAIHSVKTEVEEKEKLLNYNLAQDNLQNSLILKESDIEGNVSFSDKDCNTLTKDKDYNSSVAKDSRISDKYILDHSYPATDLEYDPLLNYTAGVLRSSLEEKDENDRQHSKHVKTVPSSNLNRSTKKSPCETRCGSPKKRSRSSSPIKVEIKLQESDDNMLIIDAPRVNVPRISRASKKLKETEENQVNLGTNAEIQQNFDINKSLNCVCMIRKKHDDITVLDHVNQRDGNKTKMKSLTSESTNLLDVNVKSLNRESKVNDWRKCCPPTKSNNSASQVKTEINREALKDVSMKVVSIKTRNIEQQFNNQSTLNGKTWTSICSEDSLKDGTAQSSSKKRSNNLGKRNIKMYETSEAFNNSQSYPLSCLSEEISPDTDLFSKNSGDKSINKIMYTHTKENEEIIVLDSSEEDDSEEGTEVYDSVDTMEECRRIFNEFVEYESQKEKMAKQALAAQTEMDLDLRTSLLPGQKRRIAHTAKFDVSTTKEIIVPFKAPLPQQTCHSRILQAQQQAVQITAAVKSGQAFVAATYGPKKSTPVMPTPQIQSMGPMVCLNVFEVQPVATSSSQLNVLLPGNALTGAPCRVSNNPVKRIAPLTVKVSSRKRPSLVPEVGSKVPHDIRQRYVNFFVEEFLKVCATVNEAFDKALMEEKAIYNRCGSKKMYLNIAVNTLKKLRVHGSASSATPPSGTKGTTSAGLGKQGTVLYQLLKDYVLTEEQLKENDYPEPNPEKPGSAMLFSCAVKPAVFDSTKRVCCRCGVIYTVTSSGKHVRKEECNYHSGRVVRHKVAGGLETHYSCCEGVIGSPGCQVAKLHVHNGRKENLDGFVKTFTKPPPPDGNHGAFALDCEMCYTTRGLELSRVTVVDPSLQVAYNTFVKPDNEIIDYNTRFSGVTAEDMKNTTTSIRDVQAVLLNLFSADTILIGHSLENDLFALKLFHNKIVDTSVVFPHRLGLPHKRALQNLMADYLRRIIQDNVGGHDCSEDATACMELMLWKVKEDTKGRR